MSGYRRSFPVKICRIFCPPSFGSLGNPPSALWVSGWVYSSDGSWRVFFLITPGVGGAASDRGNDGGVPIPKGSGENFSGGGRWGALHPFAVRSRLPFLAPHPTLCPHRPLARRAWLLGSFFPFQVSQLGFYQMYFFVRYFFCLIFYLFAVQENAFLLFFVNHRLECFTMRTAPHPLWGFLKGLFPRKNVPQLIPR